MLGERSLVWDWVLGSFSFDTMVFSPIQHFHSVYITTLSMTDVPFLQLIEFILPPSLLLAKGI